MSNEKTSDEVEEIEVDEDEDVDEEDRERGVDEEMALEVLP